MRTSVVSRWWLQGAGVWADDIEGDFHMKPPRRPGVVVGDLALYIQTCEEARPPNPLLVKQIRKLNSWPEREKTLDDLFGELKDT